MKGVIIVFSNFASRTWFDNNKKTPGERLREHHYQALFRSQVWYEKLNEKLLFPVKVLTITSLWYLPFHKMCGLLVIFWFVLKLNVVTFCKDSDIFNLKALLQIL